MMNEGGRRQNPSGKYTKWFYHISSNSQDIVLTLFSMCYRAFIDCMCLFTVFNPKISVKEADYESYHFMIYPPDQAVSSDPVLDWSWIGSAFQKGESWLRISVPVFLSEFWRILNSEVSHTRVPQIINFNKIVHYKPSILGYSPFMDTPIFLLDLLMNYENCSWPTSFERTSSFAGNFSGLEWAIGVNDAHEAWGPYESTCVKLGRCPQSTEFYWIWCILILKNRPKRWKKAAFDMQISF